MKRNISMEVHAMNQLNRITLDELRNVHEQLSELHGKRIATMTNDFEKWVSIDFVRTQPVEGGGAKNAVLQYVYLKPNSTALWLNIGISFTALGIVHYYKQEVYLGRLVDGYLYELLPIERIIDEYRLNVIISEQEERGKIAELEALKEKINGLRTTLRVSKDFIRN